MSCSTMSTQPCVCEFVPQTSTTTTTWNRVSFAEALCACLLPSSTVVVALVVEKVSSFVVEFPMFTIFLHFDRLYTLFASSCCSDCSWTLVCFVQFRFYWTNSIEMNLYFVSLYVCWCIDWAAAVVMREGIEWRIKLNFSSDLFACWEEWWVVVEIWWICCVQCGRMRNFISFTCIRFIVDCIFCKLFVALFAVLNFVSSTSFESSSQYQLSSRINILFSLETLSLARISRRPRLLRCNHELSEKNSEKLS